MLQLDRLFLHKMFLWKYLCSGASLGSLFRSSAIVDVVENLTIFTCFIRWFPKIPGFHRTHETRSNDAPGVMMIWTILKYSYKSVDVYVMYKIYLLLHDRCMGTHSAYAFLYIQSWKNAYMHFLWSKLKKKNKPYKKCYSLDYVANLWIEDNLDFQKEILLDQGATNLPIVKIEGPKTM